MRIKLWWIAALIGVAVVVPMFKAGATISSTTTETVSALGNGSTTNFTIGFTFQSVSQVAVWLQDESTTPYTRTQLTYGSGTGKFTITGTSPGTTVVMGTAPSSTQRVVIRRVVPLTQTVSYSQNAPFPASSHEQQMDRMAMALQEMDARKPAPSPSTVPSNNDTIKWNSTTSQWEYATMTSPTMGSPLSPSVGGTGISNSGLFTYGASALTLTTSAATALTLPPSGNVYSSGASYKELVNYMGDVTGASSVDFSLGNTVKMRLTGNATLSFTNVPGGSSLTSVTLMLQQDGTGSRLVTWPSCVKWSGGTAPTLTTTASKIDVISCMSPDAGTTCYCFTGGLNF